MCVCVCVLLHLPQEQPREQITAVYELVDERKKERKRFFERELRGARVHGSYARLPD